MVSIWGRPEAHAAILQVREVLVKRVAGRMMSPMQALFGVREIWGSALALLVFMMGGEKAL